MRKASLFAAVAFSVFWSAAARAGDPQSFPGELQPTRVLLCNDARQPFEVAIDDGKFQALPRRGCLVVEATAGLHVLTPRGDRVGGPWFSHAAWSVRIPSEGAVLRFGLNGDLVELTEVLEGFPEGSPPPADAAPSADAPPAEPFFLAPAYGIPLAGWHVCGPAVASWVRFDGVPVFPLAPGACGNILAPVGVHTLGYYDPAGQALIPPYTGYLPPGGDSIQIFAGMPRAQGRPRAPLPPTTELTRLRPDVRVLPAQAHPLDPEVARRLVKATAWANVARRGSGWVIAPERRARPVGPRLPRATASGDSRAWSSRARSWSGPAPRAFTAQDRAGARPRAYTTGQRASSRPGPPPFRHGSATRAWARPAPRAFRYSTGARAWARPSPRAFTYSTSARAWSRPSPRAFTYRTSARSWSSAPSRGFSGSARSAFSGGRRGR
jgi:hypothetical protein